MAPDAQTHTYFWKCFDLLREYTRALQWRLKMGAMASEIDWPLRGELPAQRTSNAENVSIWWRHHEIRLSGSLWWYLNNKSRLWSNLIPKICTLARHAICHWNYFSAVTLMLLCSYIGMIYQTCAWKKGNCNHIYVLIWIAQTIFRYILFDSPVIIRRIRCI